MKTILIVVALALSALTLGYAPPESLAQAPSPSLEQSPTGKGSQTTIIDLGRILENRVVPPINFTSKAVKDGKGLCAVHHHVLKESVVPVVYGMMLSPPYPLEIVHRLFPNAMTRVEPGCIVMPEKQAVVLQCEKCLKSKELWLERNEKHRRQLMAK